MIGEEQQEQASLYALGLLTADEAAAFEQLLSANPELAALARELRETAHHLVLGLPAATPPRAVKAAVLQVIVAERAPTTARTAPTAGKVVLFRPLAILPWAIAAGLALFCGVLATERSDLRRELAIMHAADPLEHVAVYTLGPADNPKAVAASIAWEPERQNGLLHVRGLAVPAHGKDYQLWAVDAGRKDPINAGVVKVDEQGRARVVFKPDAVASHVSAFAISLEPTGGSPKATGPIVYAGAQ